MLKFLGLQLIHMIESLIITVVFHSGAGIHGLLGSRTSRSESLRYFTGFIGSRETRCGVLEILRFHPVLPPTDSDAWIPAREFNWSFPLIAGTLLDPVLI